MLKMKMATMAVGAALLSPSAGNTAESPAIKDFDQKVICEPVAGSRPIVNPKYLIDWLYSKNPVSDVSRDFDEDGGVSSLEKIRVIADDNYKPNLEKRGALKADAKNIEAMRSSLQNLLLLNNGIHFQIVRVRGELTEAEKSASPDLQRILASSIPYGPDSITVAELLITKPQFVRITCLHDIKPDPEKKEDEKNIVEQLASAVRIRGKVKDLTVADLKKVSTADLSMQKSLNDDRAKAYSVGGVVGLDLGWEIEPLATKLIPYLSVDRRFTVHTQKASDDVNQLGLGLLGTINWDVGEASHQFLFGPQITTDTTAETSVGSMKFRWSPSFPIGDSWQLGAFDLAGPVLWRLTLDGIGNGGRVFDDGGKESLRDTNNFLYAGGELGLKLMGAPDTFLSQISFETMLRYMQGFTGQWGHLRRSESELVYTFPQQDIASLKLKYINGRMDDTFEDEDFWLLGLGLKF